MQKCARNAGADGATTDSGLRLHALSVINAHSEWRKYACGGRAYYYNSKTRAYTLKPPDDGVQPGEVPEGEMSFQTEFERAAAWDCGTEANDEAAVLEEETKSKQPLVAEAGAQL